ncbi:MAG: hemolysin family protein [Actinomycetota bacterium]|nr:hemolysin family protein [Actinomycetota bacterium]
MGSEVLLLLLVVALIAANAVFVAAEFSFVTVDRPSVERLAESGDRRARSLLAGLRTLSTQMSGAQLGITITSLVVGFIAEPSIAALLIGPLQSLGIPEGAALPISLTLALIIATGSQAIFGELVPKNWAISEPVRVGRAVASLQRGFTSVSGPLLRVLHGSANWILRKIGVEPQEELASARSPEELLSLVSHSGTSGTLDEATAELVTRSIEFGERTAADVMTPRPRVTFVQTTDTCASVMDLVAGTGHARFPVVGDNTDEVVGLAHYKNVLPVPYEDRETTPISQVMAPVLTVPESLELDPLLEQLRAAPLQLAVVIDEYGGTAGVVTLEDLVEEIVGEIRDEQDRPHHRVARDREGGWTLSGLLRPDEASDIIGVELPSGEQNETLGGLIIERLGRLATEGDSVIVSAPVLGPEDPVHLDVVLTVNQMDGRRIDRVRVRFLDSGSASEGSGSGESDGGE